jgi:hypothetical protein
MEIKRTLMENAGGGAKLITMFATFFLIFIPIAEVNASIERRKGKSRTLLGWLSIIPN